VWVKDVSLPVGGTPGVPGVVSKGMFGIAGLTAGTVGLLATLIAGEAFLFYKLLNPTAEDVERSRQGREDTARARGIPDWNNRALQDRPTPPAAPGVTPAGRENAERFRRSTESLGVAADRLADFGVQARLTFARQNLLQGRTALELQAAARKVQGKQFGVDALRSASNPRDILPLADYMSSIALRGMAPWYQKTENLQRILSELKSQQARAIARGDTVTARKLGVDIDAITAALNKKLPPIKKGLDNANTELDRIYRKDPQVDVDVHPWVSNFNLDGRRFAQAMVRYKVGRGARGG
jgi:hypothetical protein